VGYRLHARQWEGYCLLGLGPEESAPDSGPVEEFLYGGQSGGGKSHLARAVGVAVCVRWPGVRVPLFRRKYTELEDSHIPWIQQEIGAPVASYHATHHELRFANGSVLMFRHLDHEGDMYDYNTAEWGALLIDQAEMFTENMIRFLRHRVRQSRERYPDWRPVLFYSANPGGLSHQYLRNGFVRVPGVREGEAHQAPRADGGHRRCYLPARLRDNPSLDAEEYRRRLEGLPAHLVEAYLTGNWDYVVGAFFSEWRARDLEGRPWHVWPEDYARGYYRVPREAPFPPHDWPHWAAVDGGVQDRWVTLWAARAPDRRVVLYREAHGVGVQVPEQAQRITAASAGGARLERILADPAMFNRRANLTVSDAEVYAQQRVSLTPATNAREPGWRRVREALRGTGRDDGLPGLVVLEREETGLTCPYLVDTLPVLLGDPDRPEDILHSLGKKQDDHACLVAGTLVATQQGALPIEQVRPGMKVWTRGGLRRVLASGVTAHKAPVWRYVFSNGGTLTATPTHPVLRANGTWAPLDTVRYDDIIQVWAPSGDRERESGSSTTACRSTATQLPDTRRFAATTRQALGGRSGVLIGSIVRSIRTRMGQSRKATKSTTGMATRPITPPPIWNYGRPGSTKRPTSWQHLVLLRAATWSSLSGRRGVGINPLKGSPGTARTASGSGNSARRASTPATSAGNRIGPRIGARIASVATAARRHGDARSALMTWSGCVPSAGPRSASTATCPPRPVHASVARLCGSAPAGTATVYNLTVEGAHEFYANGVLVHNCDCLRYLVMPAAVPDVTRRGRDLVATLGDDDQDALLDDWQRDHDAGATYVYPGGPGGVASGWR